MPLTKAFAAGMNAGRKVFYGNGRLALMKHAGAGFNDYDLIVRVKRDWNLSRGNIDEPATLTIAESRTVTQAHLETVRDSGAFLFGSEIWKVVENQIVAPVGTQIRIWTFKLVYSHDFILPDNALLADDGETLLRTDDGDFLTP